jgi:hypothetical protein
MAYMEQARGLNSQFGFTTSDGVGYTVGGADCSFAVGQTIFVRFATRIPKGSVINSAILRFNIGVKTSSTTQSSFHTVRADARGDSPLLRPGVLEVFTRPATAASVAWTCAWTANPPDTGAVSSDINVKPLIDEILARSDYVPGAYITFMIRCTNENSSDMWVRLNAAFSPAPTLMVDFTPPASDLFISYNRTVNSEFDPMLDGLGDTDPAVSGNLPGWAQNGYFGAFVDPASTSRCSMAVDSVFTRLPGVRSMRVTMGVTPTTPAFAGPMMGVSTLPGETFILSGWIYLPPSTSGMDVYVGDVFAGWSNISGLPRGVWRPFCSIPILTPGPDKIVRFPAVGLRGWTEGVQFWISEPTILMSEFRQMPFNGVTAAKSNGVVQHRSSVGHEQSVREWIPRRVMMVDGVPKRMPTWTRRADVSTFINELSEPVKGGPQIGQLPAGQTVGGLPSGMTVTELL